MLVVGDPAADIFLLLAWNEELLANTIPTPDQVQGGVFLSPGAVAVGLATNSFSHLEIGTQEWLIGNEA